MKIARIVLQNFRCFGSERTTIRLDNLTALIGGNGCGKTALQHALLRLFGPMSIDRAVLSSDFFTPQGQSLRDEATRSLAIEAWLEFSESEGEKDDESIAACFRHLAFADKEKKLFCRLRLDATWRRTRSHEGDVEQKLSWVRTDSESISEKHCSSVKSHERTRIQVIYLPAVRDPQRQIRQISGSVMHRLISAIKWSEKSKKESQKFSKLLNGIFENEQGLASIEKTLSKKWRELHSAQVYPHIQLRPISANFDDIVNKLEPSLRQAKDGDDEPLERLSEGLKSLFYIALVSAAFELESKAASAIASAADDESNLDAEILDPPNLTIFAVEEPENHLSPHYLGTIMKHLRTIASSERAQVILASHSPSILARVEPTEVRYVQLHDEHRVSSVKEISLPENQPRALKFIREAVRAYPELYFSKLVILGEGPSEEIIIRRLSEAAGLMIDRNFVSIVPFGSRYANHFWKLLDDLGIEHLTILDLDLGRKGGGWQRIHHTLQSLILRGYKRKDVLQGLSEAEFKDMPNRDDSMREDLNTWINHIENYSIYFSAPLDLDFLMLSAMPKLYKKSGARPKAAPLATATQRDKAKKAVLKAIFKSSNPSSGALYSDEDLALFHWYRTLFLSTGPGKGKPVSHMTALFEAEDRHIRKNTPAVIKRLIKHMKKSLSSLPVEPEHDEPVHSA